MSDTLPLAVNGRYRVHRTTGVQRYAHEIVSRLASVGDSASPVAQPARLDVDILTPASGKGAVGHLWEQTALRRKAHGRLLFSPSGSGPLGYRNQVVTFHDMFTVEFPEWYSPAYARWYGFAVRRLAASALRLIAVSEYTRSRMVALLGSDPARITVIPNGCYTQGPASNDAIEAARAALRIPTRRYVLSLSSLESRKNLGATLEAWARIHRQLPEDTWLVLAGPPADPKVYADQKLPADLPRVLYPGYVPEEHLAGLYSGATLFVFPSLAEGFGLPLLEAMACGVRSITANTSSLPEVGGTVVDYVDPRQPAELAARMLARLTELSIDPGPPAPFQAAIERARLFSWDTAAAKTRDVITEAAEAMRVGKQAPRPGKSAAPGGVLRAGPANHPEDAQADADRTGRTQTVWTR